MVISYLWENLATQVKGIFLLDYNVLLTLGYISMECGKITVK